VAQLVTNPDADPETSSVDGYLYSSGTNEAWATLHDDATANFVSDNASALTVEVEAGTTTGWWNKIARTVLVFDTSSIPAGAVITDVKLTLVQYSKGNSFSGDIDIVEMTTGPSAGDDDLVSGDFNITNFAVGTVLASKAISAISGSTDFTLSDGGSFGFISISTGGRCALGVLVSHDTDDTPPTWSSGGRDYVFFRSAEYGSDKPTLTVTYTVTEKVVVTESLNLVEGSVKSQKFLRIVNEALNMVESSARWRHVAVVVSEALNMAESSVTSLIVAVVKAASMVVESIRSVTLDAKDTRIVSAVVELIRKLQ
jgi:hypothetical protein